MSGGLPGFKRRSPSAFGASDWLYKFQTIHKGGLPPKCPYNVDKVVL